jgi:hypothetical protein
VVVSVVLIVVLVIMKGVGQKSHWTLRNVCQGTFNAIIIRDASGDPPMVGRGRGDEKAGCISGSVSNIVCI